MSGIGDEYKPVINAAIRTEEFAIISFLEHNQTEDILRLSFLCFVKRNRQDKFATKAIIPMLDIV